VRNSYSQAALIVPLPYYDYDICIEKNTNDDEQFNDE